MLGSQILEKHQLMSTKIQIKNIMMIKTILVLKIYKK